MAPRARAASPPAPSPATSCAKDLPIAFWDERLSTDAVNRMLIGEADTTRARRAEVVDKTAAAWILQGALDRLRSTIPSRSKPPGTAL